MPQTPGAQAGDKRFPDRRGNWESSRVIAHEPSLPQYFREVERYPLITRQREAELARRIRGGDEEALNELVHSNLRFVVSIAKKYAGNGNPVSFADLIGEGNQGLIKAARRFDERRGYVFISYAVWWIRQGILLAITNEPTPLRVPSYIKKDINRLGAAEKACRERLGRAPGTGELLNQLIEDSISKLKNDHAKNGRTPSRALIEAVRHETEEYWSDQRIKDTFELSHPSRVISFQHPGTKEDSNRPLEETLNIEGNFPRPDEQVQMRSLHEQFEKALSTLTERERAVIILYFGLGFEDSMTLEKIGERFNLTRERIRQIKMKALLKLRAPRARTIAALREEYELS